LRELRHAILPPHHLTNIFSDWKTIVAQLAEPRRRRRRPPTAKLTLMGAAPGAAPPKSETTKLLLRLSHPPGYWPTKSRHLGSPPLFFLKQVTET
jgi:hypothetical protein